LYECLSCFPDDLVEPVQLFEAFVLLFQFAIPFTEAAFALGAIERGI
jgi:hypothetical protein